MDEQQTAQKVKVLQALADETRLELVKKISQGPLQGSCCSNLQAAFDLSQPAMSHHFKILLNAEIISEQKNGRSKIYTINNHKLESAGIDISRLLN